MCPAIINSSVLKVAGRGRDRQAAVLHPRLYAFDNHTTQTGMISKPWSPFNFSCLILTGLAPSFILNTGQASPVHWNIIMLSGLVPFASQQPVASLPGSRTKCWRGKYFSRVRHFVQRRGWDIYVKVIFIFVPFCFLPLTSRQTSSVSPEHNGKDQPPLRITCTHAYKCTH